jgi:hypothetical protein
VNRAAQIIAETVLAELKAGGFSLVRNADTTFSDDVRELIFARSVAGNAAMALQALEEDAGITNTAPEWSPAQSVGQ